MVVLQINLKRNTCLQFMSIKFFLLKPKCEEKIQVIYIVYSLMENKIIHYNTQISNNFWKLKQL